MATLGSLVVTLEANVAKFQSDLGKATSAAEGAMKRIGEVAGLAGDALGTLGEAFALMKVAEFSKGLIDAAGHLQDMSARTGASVEALSAMQTIAARTGTDLETVSAAFAKLEKTAAAAVGGNTAAKQAFAALGIGAQQLADGLKKPDDLFLEVAQKLDQFQNDGNKTALMMALMGRGASQSAAFFAKLAEEGYNSANTTAEQAARAKELTDRLEELDTAFKTLARDFLIDEGFPLFDKLKIGLITLVYDFDVMVTKITGYWEIGLAEMGSGWGRFATSVGNTMQILGQATGPFRGVFSQVGSALSAANWGKNDPAKLKADLAADLATKATAMQLAVNDFNAKSSPGVQLANRAKPSAPTIMAADKIGELQKALTSRLKVIQDAIKAEDSAEKLGNELLDRDYANGVVGLADYSEQKSRILEEGFQLRQKLYDSEMAAVVAQMPILERAGKAEEGLSHIRAIADAKLADQNKHEQDRETLLVKLTADSAKYAKQLTDLDKTYLALSGDSATIAKLQFAEQYGMLQLTAAANGNTDALMKLDAIQRDMALRAAKDPLSGMRRAMIDYGQTISDVASKTQQMTTNMFKGMEDALVEFARTGKLNFKNMIDSFIADLIRLQIQKQVETPILDFIGSFFGSPSSGANAGLSSGPGAGGTMDTMPGEAAGGSVVGGQAYMVGERGPETFVPASNGRIIPYAGPQGNGGPQVIYSPQIRIDARSDRTQIQAEMMGITREGNKQLLAMLMRYNPYLRT